MLGLNTIERYIVILNIKMIYASYFCNSHGIGPCGCASLKIKNVDDAELLPLEGSKNVKTVLP